MGKPVLYKSMKGRLCGSAGAWSSAIRPSSKHNAYRDQEQITQSTHRRLYFCNLTPAHTHACTRTHKRTHAHTLVCLEVTQSGIYCHTLQQKFLCSFSVCLLLITNKHTLTHAYMHTHRHTITFILMQWQRKMNGAIVFVFRINIGERFICSSVITNTILRKIWEKYSTHLYIFLSNVVRKIYHIKEIQSISSL